ncbi:MAG: hypothetical protein ACKOX3_02315 [Bacteroidota bacterium]
MKQLFLFIFCLFTLTINAQESRKDTNQTITTNYYKVVLNSGKTYVGTILKQDAREVLINTKEVGDILIPKFEISLIEQISKDELGADGTYKPSEVFATRYFITTNGLPIKKGDSYIQWNLYGPDFQFGVSNNFGLGIMTTWVGVPIIAQAKYSIKLSDQAHLGIGGLLGTGSWVAADFGLALPFTSFTLGDRRTNATFSAGYGSVWSKGQSSGRALLSVAAMAKISNKISIVFDSFIVPASGTKEVTTTESVYNPNTLSWEEKTTTTTEKRTGLEIFIPGIRWQLSEEKAFQFGFTGFGVDGSLEPAVIPMIQWYRKL